MNEENGRVYELQSETTNPFYLKTSDGMVHKFDSLGIPKKVERDDCRVIVTINPGRNGSESQYFFPLGEGVEIVYGCNQFNYDRSRRF